MIFLASIFLITFLAIQGRTEGMAVGRIHYGTQGDYHLWRAGEGLAVFISALLLGLGWLAIPTALIGFPVFEFVFARTRGLDTWFNEEPWEFGPWEYSVLSEVWLGLFSLGIIIWCFLLARFLIGG